MISTLKRWGLAVAVLGLAVGATGRAEASLLVGTIATGRMLINGNPPNYFDPANGFVPAIGFLNSTTSFNSPTVPIIDPAVEYGYHDSANAISADFTDSTLTLGFTQSSGGALPITFTFTDAAFTGLTVANTSDNFIGGTTFSLVGDVLTINTPNFLGISGDFAAAFSFSPAVTAVPEPSTLISAGLAGLMGIGYGWKRRKARATA